MTTNPTLFTGVSGRGTRRCSPPLVPTQMSPSRSSSSDCTESLESPVCRSARSTRRPSRLRAGRHSPQAFAEGGDPEVAFPIVEKPMARALWRLQRRRGRRQAAEAGGDVRRPERPVGSSLIPQMNPVASFTNVWVLFTRRNTPHRVAIHNSPSWLT